MRMVLDPSDLTTLAPLSSTTQILADAVAASGDVAESSYSKVSYYTTLALYVMSFPGLWSQIKRSTTAKLKRKTYTRLVIYCGRFLFTKSGVFYPCLPTFFYVLEWK